MVIPHLPARFQTSRQRDHTRWPFCGGCGSPCWISSLAVKHSSCLFPNNTPLLYRLCKLQLLRLHQQIKLEAIEVRKNQSSSDKFGKGLGGVMSRPKTSNRKQSGICGTANIGRCWIRGIKKNARLFGKKRSWNIFFINKKLIGNWQGRQFKTHVKN